MSKEKVPRRGFVKTAATGIVGLAVGAAIGYGASEASRPPTTAQPTAGPAAVLPFPYNLPKQGETPTQRAINAAKFLIQQRPEWKGTELVLACTGGYEPGFNAMKPQWEQETGTKVTIAPTPLPEFFDKMMVEAVSKTGNIDLLSMQTMYVSDLVEAGLLYQLDDFANHIDIREHGRPDGYVYPLEWQIPRYQGRLYGFLQDGDVMMAYYLSDFFKDPKEQQAFEKQYGYPLKAPLTMEQYTDQIKFFYRPPDLFGHVEGRELTRNAFTYYCYLNSSRWPNFYYFNDNMEPQLLEKEAVEMANLYVANTKYGPPNLPELLGPATYPIMADYKAVFAFGVPSLARTIEDPKAKSKGRWLTTPIPGHWVTTPDGKKIINRRSVNLASWSQGVSNHSKKRELACCLAAYFTAPDQLIKAELAPATWHDPCRYNAVGINAPKELRDVRGPVLDFFEESASIFTPMVQSMLGATEYNVTLSKNLHAAMIGTMDAVKALEATTKQWNEITERYGKEKQIKSWRALKSFYPTTVLPW